jgi:hypothetical protein
MSWLRVHFWWESNSSSTEGKHIKKVFKKRKEGMKKTEDDEESLSFLFISFRKLISSLRDTHS